MITKEELAERLNNREYRCEIAGPDATDANENRLVIIYGASDDLTYFEGFFHEEAGAFDGAVHRVTIAGNVYEDGDEDDEYLQKGWTAPAIVMTVNAEWCPKGFEGSWRITPSIPFASFDILEDGELYCRGAVVEFPKATG